MLYSDCVSSYPHMFCCWRKFGIQGSCTHSFHWCWYNFDCIQEYPEHTHLCLQHKLHIHNITIIDNRLLCYTLTVYLLTHTCSVVGGDLVSIVATAHIASIRVGTILIASMNTQSTFIYICVVHIKFIIYCLNTFLPTHVLLLEEIWYPR